MTFLPVTGDILLWQEPAGDGVRVESGLLPQDTVSIHYDPMLAKIVAWGEDRETAVRRLLRALETTTLHGLVSNLPFLGDILRQPAFQSGALSTHFIERPHERLAAAQRRRGSWRCWRPPWPSSANTPG
jgi:acetyl/propionyl-CoA carboxylase alpha subunit